MSESEKTGTIYQEMIERRSRSERLNALAAEKGLDVYEAPQVESLDADPEIEMKPAFDETEFQNSHAEMVEDAQDSKEEMELDASEDGFDTIPADPVEALDSSVVDSVSEEAVENPETESAIQNEETAAAIEEVSDKEPTSITEELMPEEVQAEVETDPISEIEESESLLGEEPQIVSDAEVTRVAEELVDRIGPVVDIQNLPKTQPSRILSKTTKPPEAPKPTEAEKTPEAGEKAPEGTIPDFQDVLEENDSPDEKASKANSEEKNAAKKKKKKVSLLDSYFKGM